jgi:surfeit locus 1 family protein
LQNARQTRPKPALALGAAALLLAACQTAAPPAPDLSLNARLRLAEAAPAVAAGSASRTSFATVDPVQFPAIAGARLVPEVWVAAHQVRRPDGSLVANPFAAPDLPNRHFEYAITWYGLAGALLAVYVARLVRRPRGAAAPRAANQPPDSPRQA